MPTWVTEKYHESETECFSKYRVALFSFVPNLQQREL